MGVSEGRLGVRPPLEGLEWPRRQHNSAGCWRQAQRGDMPALFSDLCWLLALGRDGRQQVRGWGFAGVSAVQKQRR